MKTRFTLALLLAAATAGAQAPKNALELQASLLAAGHVPAAGPAVGAAFSYVHSFRPGSAWTLSASFTTVSGSSNKRKTLTRVLGGLLGYRHTFGAVDLEPQLGIGELGGREPLEGGLDWVRPSVAALLAGFNAYYRVHPRLGIGLRGHWAKGMEGAGAGAWHDRSVPFAGVSARFRLSGNR